ncbi:MAG: DUF4411 family protein [Spirochaetota bacterium]|nr:DUF4411 family protein [Spirochaetota bacterium]
MSDAKYVLDTNVFINLHRVYPVDVFGTLWAKIEKVIDDGAAISSDEVLGELSIDGDALFKWANKRKHIFIRSDDNIQLKVREILKNYPDILTGTRKANGADPFVIALAILKSCTVVSDETFSGASHPKKIPDVCNAYGVPVMKFIAFLRELKIKI